MPAGGRVAACPGQGPEVLRLLRVEGTVRARLQNGRCQWAPGRRRSSGYAGAGGCWLAGCCLPPAAAAGRRLNQVLQILLPERANPKSIAHHCCGVAVETNGAAVVATGESVAAGWRVGGGAAVRSNQCSITGLQGLAESSWPGGCQPRSSAGAWPESLAALPQPAPHRRVGFRIEESTAPRSSGPTALAAVPQRLVGWVSAGVPESRWQPASRPVECSGAGSGSASRSALGSACWVVGFQFYARKPGLYWPGAVPPERSLCQTAGGGLPVGSTYPPCAGGENDSGSNSCPGAMALPGAVVVPYRWSGGETVRPARPKGLLPRVHCIRWLLAVPETWPTGRSRIGDLDGSSLAIASTGRLKPGWNFRPGGIKVAFRAAINAIPQPSAVGRPGPHEGTAP